MPFAHAGRAQAAIELVAIDCAVRFIGFLAFALVFVFSFHPLLSAQSGQVCCYESQAPCCLIAGLMGFCCLAMAVVEFVALFSLPGLAGWGCPAATHFLLLRQNKVSKEKATRLSGSLRFASGDLCCPEKAGVELELAFGSDNRSP